MMIPQSKNNKYSTSMKVKQIYYNIIQISLIQYKGLREKKYNVKRKLYLSQKENQLNAKNAIVNKMNYWE